MLSAKSQQRDGDRHADEGTEQAPQERPEEHCKKDDEWGDGERTAGDARLYVAADDELNDIEAGEHGQRRLPGCELRQCKQRREDGGDEWPDERDIVKCKGNDDSFKRKLEAGKEGQ